MKIKLIENIRASQEKLSKEFTQQLTAAIKEQLSLLTEDKAEFLPVSLCNEYNDHYNHINKDGSLVIYNSEDCLSDSIAHDDSNVLEWSDIDEQIEVLQVLVGYNKLRLNMTDDDFNNLDTVLQSLDPESELSISLDKAIKKLKL